MEFDVIRNSHQRLCAGPTRVPHTMFRGELAFAPIINDDTADENGDRLICAQCATLLIDRDESARLEARLTVDGLEVAS